jgi:hypothetical protein
VRWHQAGSDTDGSVLNVQVQGAGLLGVRRVGQSPSAHQTLPGVPWQPAMPGM